MSIIPENEMTFDHVAEALPLRRVYGGDMANLAEELLLLAFHDDTGRNQVMNLEYGLAGGIILDLALAERIDVVDKKVQVISAEPTGDRLLDDMLQRLADDKQRRAQSVIQRLARGLTQAVRDGLVADGVLEHERDTVLAVFPYNRYRPTSQTDVEAEVRRRLETAIDTGQADDRTRGLATLVHILQMERKVFPDRKAREVRRALKELSEASWSARATKAAIDSVMAATMSAAVAAGAAAAAAGG